MICPNCEFEIEDDIDICPYCHTFVRQVQTPVDTVTASEQDAGPARRLSEKEFMELPQMKQCRKNIRFASIMFYVLAVISFFVSMYFLKSSLPVLDMILMIGLTLGIHLGRSRVCAVILCAYSLINVIVVWYTMGRPGGYLPACLSISLCLSVFQIRNAWKRYVATGVLPMEPLQPAFKKRR